MTDRNDISPEAVERFSSYSVMMSLEDGKYITSPNGEWVRYDDYVAQSTHIAELEAGLAEQIKWVRDLADDLAAAEAKLSQALESLSLIAVVGQSDDPKVNAAIARQTVTQARDALAEIKGENT